MIIFKHKKDRGVTLVELMIAVSIILIAIIPLMSMIIQSVQGTQKLSDRSRASQLVQDMIEEVKQKRWDEDPWNPGQLGYEDPSEDPTAAGGRLNCDDIDDYIAYNDSSSGDSTHMIENPPVDEAGNDLDPSKFSKFVRETAVSYVNVPIDGNAVSVAGNGSGSGGANPTRPFKQVDVWVSWNDAGNPADDAGVGSGVTGSTTWVWEVADNFVHSQTIIANPAN
jgi:prepilin-type N-terminal cleavage/methylation domain-containing protein